MPPQVLSGAIVPPGAGTGVGPGPDLSSRRAALAAALAGAAGAVVLGSFWRERYEVWALALTILLGIAAVRLGRWWPGRRGVVTTLTVDVLLIFAYLWTLDERLPVTVVVTSRGYTATIGTNRLVAQVPPRPGRLALFAGDASSYRVQPTGEAPFPTTPTALARIGEVVRFATPKPAWAGIRVTRGGRALVMRAPALALTGRFTGTVRGEWESSGGVAAFAAVLRPPYVVHADLMRPDGTQGLLLGLDQQGQAYLLQIRMDRPDLAWVRWLAGATGPGISGSPVRTDLYEMTQRTLRLLLANAIGALLLTGLAILLSVLGAPLFSASRPVDQLATVERWLERRGLTAAIVVLVATAGLLAAALIADGLLGRIPHVQDDVAYVFQAKTFALGRLWVPAPALPRYFAEDFINVYHGRWFGKYPPGWPALLAVGEFLGQGWLVNPTLAAVDLVLIFLIGREVYGRNIGLIAGLLTLSSPFFLFLAGSYMAHTATLAYLAGFVWLLLRWVRRVDGGHPAADRWLPAGAGFLLGLAFITRQLDAVAFAAPFALLGLSPAVRRRLPAGLTWLALGGSIPLTFMLAYDRVLTGNPLTTPYALWSPFDRLGFGPTTLYSHTPAQGLHNTSQSIEMLLADLFGWPYYLTLALALVPFVVGRVRRWDAIFGLSTLSVMGAYVFYWGAGIMYGPRYYYVTIPWLTLLSARGLDELYLLPGRLRRRRKDRTTAALFPSLLLAGLLVYNLRVYLPANIPIYSGYNFVSQAPVEAVRRAGIHRALVFTVSRPAWSWWSYGAVFSSNSPLLNGDVVYARDLGAADRRLMRLFPGRRYYRLDGAVLTELRP